MRKPIISARLWTTWSAQRGSSMHHARRSATRSRFSTSARARTPPFEDSIPPSKRATTDLLRTDDKPVSGSVGSFMAGVVSGTWRGSAQATKSYVIVGVGLVQRKEVVEIVQVRIAIAGPDPGDPRRVHDS